MNSSNTGSPNVSKSPSKGRIWTKLGKGASLPDKSKLIAGDYFSKQGKIMKSKRFFELYPTHIYYYSEKDHFQPKGMTEITFDLCFEFLRDKHPQAAIISSSGGEKKEDKIPPQLPPGKPRGIKLDRLGGVCELFSIDEKVLFKWRDALRNIINQRGFHELFRAHKKIGKGNFASVYLAERLEDDKMFAVKAFSKEAAYSQEKGKEALLNEIDLMRALDHPNIMKLHEVFETENSLYFILDLLEGGQLYDKMKAKHRYNPEEIKDIIRGLLEGIAEMHLKRIMHRDLKPENVLFRDSNVKSIVIADLGLATRCDIPEYLFVRCGTPGFVAPEVVNIKNLNTTYEPICDLFSVGLMFHILLIGKSPFDGKTYNDILSQNRACNIKFDAVEYLRLPLQTYDILKRMLEKDPRLRISAQEALRHPYFENQHAKQQPQQPIIVHSPSQISNSESTRDEIKEDSMNSPNSRNSSSPNSPMMSPNNMTRQYQQQKNGALNQDSCLTFKMAGTPIMYGRTVEGSSNGESSPMSSSGNNDSFSCLEQKARKESAGVSTFGNDGRIKSTSFGGSSLGQKSPDLAKSNLKRALMNNMKDFHGGMPDQLIDDVQPNQQIKKKDTVDVRNKLKDNI